MLGVYSFKVKTAPQSVPLMKNNEVKLASGLVVNVAIKGNTKIVHLESQVLIVNNLAIPVTVFVKDFIQTDDPADLRPDQVMTIQAQSFFRAPLTWIVS